MMNEIRVEVISKDSFSGLGFGTVIEAGDIRADTETGQFNWWNKLAVITHKECSLGMVEAQPVEKVKNSSFEHHGKTTEMLIPTTTDVYLFLGKGKSGKKEELDLKSVKAFKLKAGQAVVLDPYIWHCAPIAGEKIPTRIFVLFENGTPEDDFFAYNTAEKENIVFKI